MRRGGFTLHPGRVEQIVGAVRSIVQIHNGSGENLDLADERELEEVGDAWAGGREGKDGCAAPFGEFLLAR